MDSLYRHLENPKYVPQGTCRIEWVNDWSFSGVTQSLLKLTGVIHHNIMESTTDDMIVSVN